MILLQGRRFGLLGYPVAHSMSPALHRHWLHSAGIPGTYDRFEHRLGDAGTLAQLQALDGANLTVPLKQWVLPHLDTLDPLAAQIGAVNTVVRSEHGWHGLNTDAEGLCRELDDLGGRCDVPALVIGAGGAARAAVFGLLERGCPALTVVNRTRSRAEQLLEHAQRAYPSARLAVNDLSQGPELLRHVGLVIQAGSGSIRPHLLGWSTADLSPSSTWIDLNYWDPQPPLLDALHHRGIRVGRGRHMLVHQAALAFRAFTGVFPSVRDGLTILGVGGSTSPCAKMPPED